MSFSAVATNETDEELSPDDLFLLFEISEMPASIQQRSSPWLERMLRMCAKCGDADTLFNAIGAELLHRRGR